MLKQKYFLADIFILSAEKQPIKLSWRKIEWLPKVICTYDHYIEKHKKLLKSSPISNIPFSEKKEEDKKAQFQQLLTGGGTICNN